MAHRLDGKVCIVTGATSGIGRESAILFGEEGAKVVLVGRRAEMGAEVEKIIRDAGGEATFIQCDLTDDAQVDAMVEKAIETYGRIDVLFGNAGAGPGVNFLEFDMEKDYKPIFDLNIRADIYLTRKIVPYMVEQGGGSCIYTTSAAAEAGAIGLSHYSPTKGAVKMFARTLALELGPHNIRFNTIQPGVIKSEMSTGDDPVSRIITGYIPLGRMGTGREVGYAAVFLASDESAFVTGSELKVDGGFTAGLFVDPVKEAMEQDQK